MNLPSTDQTLQFAALFLAVIEFILALYVLLLNPWHRANRHVSTLVLLVAFIALGQGLMLGATTLREAYVPVLILSACASPVQPLILITAIALLKPSWLPGSGATKGRGRWRWLWVLAYIFALLPLALTVIDVTTGTRLWYSGLDAQTYQGGLVTSSEFTNGAVALSVRDLTFRVIPLLTFIPLLYVALLDKEVTPPTRRLAWVLVALQVAATVISLGLREFLPEVVVSLMATAVFAFAYAFVILRQMVSERRIQRGRLRSRMTVLILAVAVPLLMAVPLFVSMQAGEELSRASTDQLQATNRSLGASVSVWLDLNLKALEQLVTIPDIISMDAQAQKPVLEAMAAAFDHMYLVSTTDLSGMNIARNDDAEPKDYSDRVWFQGPRDGASLTFQTLIGRTSGEPAWVASMPIRNQVGEIIGVGMFASDLTDIAGEVVVSGVGETGFAYVVDADNMVIAHPDPAIAEAGELVDLSDHPAVSALRQGARGLVTYTDGEGQRWQAYVDEVEHGWGVIVQQQEAELLGIQQSFRNLSWVLIAVGATILLVLTWTTVAQAFRPIDSLTETAAAIAAGDLEAEAPIESEDEVGVLARTFNSMTGQLRELIGGLEQRVAERTRDLERRTRYLEASGRVARDTAAVLDPQQLLAQVVSVISERFGFYHTGIFLLDEGKEWAVLQAASSEGGRRMLERGHRLRVGEVGIVGFVTSQGKPRVALDVGEDAVFFDNPDLPETHSEIALPLQVRGEILGALDVQSTEAAAFTDEDMAILQTMADQVAVAINNAQLFQQAEAALDAERRAYGEISREAWEQLLRARPELGFRCDEFGVMPVGHEVFPEEPGEETGQAAPELPELTLQIRVYDQVLGTIQAHKPDSDEGWTAEEITLMETLADQLGTALESARLYQETQRRATQERLLSEVTARMRETLDVDTVLQTAVREMRETLQLAEVEVRVGSADGEESI